MNFEILISKLSATSFCKGNEEQDNVASALYALLHQLFSRQPEHIQHAIPVWEKTGNKLVKEVPELWRMLLAAARMTRLTT